MALHYIALHDITFRALHAPYICNIDDRRVSGRRPPRLCFARRQKKCSGGLTVLLLSAGRVLLHIARLRDPVAPYIDFRPLCLKNIEIGRDRRWEKRSSPASFSPPTCVADRYAEASTCPAAGKSLDGPTTDPLSQLREARLHRSRSSVRDGCHLRVDLLARLRMSPVVMCVGWYSNAASSS